MFDDVEGLQDGRCYENEKSTPRNFLLWYHFFVFPLISAQDVCCSECNRCLKVKKKARQSVQSEYHAFNETRCDWHLDFCTKKLLLYVSESPAFLRQLPEIRRFNGNNFLCGVCSHSPTRSVGIHFSDLFGGGPHLARFLGNGNSRPNARTRAGPKPVSALGLSLNISQGYLTSSFRPILRPKPPLGSKPGSSGGIRAHMRSSGRQHNLLC